MPVAVPSFAKINLGLSIGPLRADGFHQLRTVYQTIALHDVIRVQVGRGLGIEIRCEDSRVPRDESNTCYRVIEPAMGALKARGRVIIEIEKRLPVQGGLGGASGNAVAALLALERALKKRLSGPERLRIAAEVGSDLPLFLVGGTVLGVGRGEGDLSLPRFPSVPCVIATPGIAVSTPKAFADWDRIWRGRPRPQVAEQRSARTGRSRVPTRLLPLPPDMPVSSEGTAELRSARTGAGARPHTGNGPRVGNGDPDASELTAAAGSDRMLELGRQDFCWAERFIRCPCEQRQGPGRDSASRPRPYRDRKRL